MSDPDLPARRWRLSVPELARRPMVATGCCAFPAEELIAHNLTLLPEVQFVRCDQERGEIWLDVEPDDLSIDQVIAILADLGYPAAVVDGAPAPNSARTLG